MHLETKLETLLPAGDGPFKVVAFELTHDGEGWSVNTPFCIQSSGDRAETLSILRARWETFKANYGSKSRVSDIQDASYTEGVSNLEVDCKAFADVETLKD